MSPLTLVLLVDAFRPDYLQDAPYLRHLATESAVGRLREPFGFVPRAAYFGGLSPEEFGYSNMFGCDASRSPFSVARWLPAAAFDAAVTAKSARAFVNEQARARTTPFAASYVSSLNVPPEILPHLVVAEVEPPWSPSAGYRSIFHELDELGWPWLWCGWPQTNDLLDSSDRGIVKHTLQTLTSDHRFAFVHLQELDGAGHAFGPEGARLRELVTHTDTLVAELVESLRATGRPFNTLIFGDHGMVSVTRPVDVRPALSSTGLRPGVDFLYFLDSSMVRLWFLTDRSREPLIDALGRVAGLRALSEGDKVHHRIARCHPANAHEVFLAEPGVVVAPDFFSGSSAPPLGMHGYDPDCLDNQGLFLAWGSDVPSGDAGIVDATEVRTWARELLGFAAPRPDRVSSSCEAPAPRFTQSEVPGADAAVAAQIDAVLDRLRPLTRDADAIVLTGSFGRGEGGVVAGATAPIALNDFDLLIVGGRDISGDLADMSAPLAASAGLDFLDLVWTDGRFADTSATILNFDLRYGSQVLAGDMGVLERMPRIAAADIPKHESLILLLNRTGGLLSGLRGPMLTREPLRVTERSYLCNQIVKALVAVGDAYLVDWRAYDTSYRVRRTRFAALAPGAGVSEAVRDLVDCAYRLKVQPDYDELPDPVGAAIGASAVVLDALRRAASSALGSDVHSVAQLSASLQGVSGEWVPSDNRRLLEREPIASLMSCVAARGASIRQGLYAALSLLLADLCLPATDARSCLSTLRCTLALDPQDSSLDWETLRALVVPAWLAMNH